MLGNNLLLLSKVVDVLLTFEMKSVSPCVYILKTIVGLMWMGEGEEGSRWRGYSLNYQLEILFFSFLSEKLSISTTN